MNYQRIYDQLIDRARTRKLKGYKERHHIIPRCLSGTDDKDNLVELTAKEHFLSHKLLCKIHPNNKSIQFAYWAMVVYKSKKNQREYKVSSREYQLLREQISSMMSVIKTGTQTPHTAQTKQKIKIALTGKPKTKEHSKKIWESRNKNGKNIPWNKGLIGVQCVTEETKEKMRQARLGKKYKKIKD